MGYPRSESIKVFCPYCGSRPGFKCIGVKGEERLACHQERVNSARFWNSKESKVKTSIVVDPPAV